METSKQRRERYLRRQLKGLSEPEKAEKLKHLIEQETLDKWREMGLKAWADWHRSKEPGTFDGGTDV